MDSVSVNSPVVVCGNGRIGSALVTRLKEASISCLSARLTSVEGLTCLAGTLPKQIKALVICIAPGGRGEKPQKWLWQAIFLGLGEQLARRDHVVEKLIMVSSSRVYEGIEFGLVDAQTKPVASSVNGQGLMIAERVLLDCPTQTLILRCSGLYGELYPVYTPILLAGKDKPRFGVDANQVVERLVHAVIDNNDEQLKQNIELLTDGRIYFNGQQYLWPADRAIVEKLANRHRILINS